MPSVEASGDALIMLSVDARVTKTDIACVAVSSTDVVMSFFGVSSVSIVNISVEVEASAVILGSVEISTAIFVRSVVNNPKVGSSVVSMVVVSTLADVVSSIQSERCLYYT